MKQIAVLTSGGDAPGMNAAIRAVTRAAIDKGWEVTGVQHGYQGLIDGKFIPLGAREVGGILQRGGTMLGSARCPEFRTRQGREKALRSLNRAGIEGLIVIGGNGSQTGSYELNRLGFPVVGVASTIDNDLYGSDMTIGVDTALNIALEAVDRLKITASSHQRAFLLEVMGRDCGYLAMMAGIAGGAEKVVIPEVETKPEEVADAIEQAYLRGKTHAMIIVAEGAKYNALKLNDYFKAHEEDFGFELRVAILGHIQRGGNPNAHDRILASQLGAGAVDYLYSGTSGVLTGIIKNEVTATSFEEVVNNKKPLDLRLLKLASVLDK